MEIKEMSGLDFLFDFFDLDLIYWGWFSDLREVVWLSKCLLDFSIIYLANIYLKNSTDMILLSKTL